MNILLESKFQAFKADLQKRNCEFFVIVKTKKGKQVFTDGNQSFAKEYLDNAEKDQRRMSREWVPKEKCPTPSTSIADIFSSFRTVRPYASKILKHYMGAKQKLGKGY